MQPFGRDIYEVPIFGHDLCELVTIVLRPGRRKRLRNIMDRCFIGLVLGMNGPPGDKKNHEQVAQYLLHYFASPKMLLTSSPRGIAVPDQARSSYCLGAVLTLSLRIFARAPLMNVYFGWVTRDWIRAGMVGSGASAVGSWPRSRRVWLVVGPMGGGGVVAEGVGGEGAYGGEEDVGGEGQVGGFQEGEEIAGC